jgi:hypothetical protein
MQEIWFVVMPKNTSFQYTKSAEAFQRKKAIALWRSLSPLIPSLLSLMLVKEESR